MKRALIGVGVAVWIVVGAGVALAQTIEGVVFVDENANGVVDPGETGLADVSVSDGASVVRTDNEGRFALEPDENARFVFVTTPTGTRATHGWFLPLDDGGVYGFPMTRVDTAGPLLFAQLSDVHYAPTPEEFKLGLRDRRMEILPDPILEDVRADINATGVDFAILAGDIVADSKYPDPDVVDRWMASMMRDYAAGFDAPFYGVVGNHDVVRDEAIGKSIYEAYAGPTYYSFDVKGVHVIVLDTQQLVGTSLVYTIDARQLGWLEEDLGRVGPEAPILVFCHEPTYDWADTPENDELFDLLHRAGITALLNGHWHTNAVLREEPFLEITSGAVCGAWWEGAGPDGSGFGYRLFRLVRGGLDSFWKEPGGSWVDVVEPSTATLAWADRLEASVWGRADSASYRWDDGDAVPVDAFWNGLWSSISANLNVSTLADGYHTLTLEFAMDGGTTAIDTRTYHVSNPTVSLEEIFAHEETYRGKLVAAPRLQVRAAMGSDISAYDETKTIIISKFPYSVARNDAIGIVGMYRPTGTAPIKAYDGVFFTVWDEDED